MDCAHPRLDSGCFSGRAGIRIWGWGGGYRLPVTALWEAAFRPGVCFSSVPPTRDPPLPHRLQSSFRYKRRGGSGGGVFEALLRAGEGLLPSPAMQQTTPSLPWEAEDERLLHTHLAKPSSPASRLCFESCRNGQHLSKRSNAPVPTLQTAAFSVCSVYLGTPTAAFPEDRDTAILQNKSINKAVPNLAD